LVADPLLHADLLRISGDLLFKLQAWKPAAEQLQAAVALYESQGRAGSAEALDARFRLMDAHGLDEDCVVAREQGEHLLQRADASFGPRHRWAVSTRLQMAGCTLALGRPEDAIGELQAALALPVVPGEDRARLILLGQHSLGNALLELGRPLEAREQFDRVLAGAAAVPGYHQADLLSVRFGRLKSFGLTGDIATIAVESAPLLADAGRLLGEAAPTTLKVRDLRAQALALQGQYAQAVTLQRDVLRLQQQRPAADAENEQHARSTLAHLLALAGQPDEALPLARAALAFFDAKYPQPDFYRESHRLRLAGVLLRAGRYEEAAEVFAMTVRHMETLPAHPTHPRFAEALAGQALATQALGQPAAARAMIDRACAVPQPPMGRAATRCAAHQAWLHGLAAADGGLAGFDAAALAYAATLPPGHAAHAELALMRAELLAAAGRRAEAQAEGSRGAAAWAQAMGRPWRGPLVALR
jgi:tetratricopeptide (TPR) repeat protein